jgi:hypothetical protein
MVSIKSKLFKTFQLLTSISFFTSSQRQTLEIKQCKTYMTFASDITKSHLLLQMTSMNSFAFNRIND